MKIGIFLNIYIYICVYFFAILYREIYVEREGGERV